jgi:hypothetical protein
VCVFFLLFLFPSCRLPWRLVWCGYANRHASLLTHSSPRQCFEKFHTIERKLQTTKTLSIFCFLMSAVCCLISFECCRCLLYILCYLGFPVFLNSVLWNWAPDPVSICNKSFRHSKSLSILSAILVCCLLSAVCYLLSRVCCLL